jgi:hypothetical protein
MLAAATALAQPEQWLEYHVSREPTGYRWIELSTNPPPEVALPKLTAPAHHGSWTHGLEPAGRRHFSLDRSRRSGPCDRLYFDTNGDGRLDDETPVMASRRDEYMTFFGPIKLVFKGEDGPVSYHLILRFMQFEEEAARLLVGAGGWYGGQVTLAGKKRQVRLLDNTVNGVFNDVGETPRDSDQIVVEGETGFSRFLGRYLEVDGQLLAIEVARDGAFLKVKAAEGVAFGAVQVPETITELTVFGANGHFLRKPAQGKFELPAGQYGVQSWEIVRSDDRGARWQLVARGAPAVAAFEVPSGQITDLPVGEPIYAALEISEARRQLQFALRLLGPLGESVDILRGTERPRAPQLQVAGVGFSATRNFEYG